MDAFNNYVEPHSVLMVMENPPSEAALMQISGVEKVDFLTDRQIRLFFTGDGDIAERLIETSVHNNWRLKEINLDKTALDEIFKLLSTRSTNHKA
jgi:ABC-2 type transport system ATP-binding protein